MARAAITLCSAALFCLGAPAGAWGPLGHRAVGAVADSLLAPTARAQVAELLADDRDRDGRPSGRTTLAEVSLWADEIRGTAADQPTWHFDNMPVCGAITPPRLAALRRTSPPDIPWCPDQQCAGGQFDLLVAQLADRRVPTARRRDALKWIVHLAGDLHQPLHAADFAQGGNLVHVQFAGYPSRTPWSLHAAWDIRLVASAMHIAAGQPPPPSALRRLIARARKIPEATRKAPVGAWLAESNRLAREVAFDYPGFFCDRAPEGAAIVTLSMDYQRRALRVVTERLALAGARLATVLNRAMAEP